MASSGGHDDALVDRLARTHHAALAAGQGRVSAWWELSTATQETRMAAVRSLLDVLAREGRLTSPRTPRIPAQPSRTAPAVEGAGPYRPGQAVEFSTPFRGFETGRIAAVGGPVPEGRDHWLVEVDPDHPRGPFSRLLFRVDAEGRSLDSPFRIDLKGTTKP